jgi:hypothetical protein
MPQNPYQRPTSKETTLRDECLRVDDEFTNESLNPVEYEMANGKREFRGYYKKRGAYA